MADQKTEQLVGVFVTNHDGIKGSVSGVDRISPAPPRQPDTTGQGKED